MQASLTYIGGEDGASWRADTESGHHLIVDGSANIGGKNSGARPMELVLLGLGSCSAMDVLEILRKGRKGDMMPVLAVGAILAALACALIAPNLAITRGDLLLSLLMGVVSVGGGFILFTLDEEGLPKLSTNFDSNPEAMALQLYAQNWAKAIEAASIEQMAQSIIRSSDLEDEGDEGNSEEI